MYKKAVGGGWVLSPSQPPATTGFSARDPVQHQSRDHRKSTAPSTTAREPVFFGDFFFGRGTSYLSLFWPRPVSRRRTCCVSCPPAPSDPSRSEKISWRIAGIGFICASKAAVFFFRGFSSHIPIPMLAPSRGSVPSGLLTAAIGRRTESRQDVHDPAQHEKP